MRRNQCLVRQGLFLLLGLSLTTHLFAQAGGGGLRPGSSSRGTLGSAGTAGRAGGTTFGGTGGGGASSASSTGQRQYRSNTLLGDAVIQVDPETRSLIIVTDEDTHTELDKMVADLDRPKPQVLIKVVFMEITYNNASDIGVEGSYTFNLKNPIPATTGSNVATTTTNTTNATTGATTNIVNTLTTPLGTPANIGQTIGLSNISGLAALTQGSFVRLASDDWSATIRALVTKGKVEILSRPSIMARNNQQAVIIVGQEVPFVTNSQITDTGQTINTVKYDNVGIILSVTPFITNNNMVEMIVAPEISALTDQTIAISNTATAPVISKRSAETVVVTPDGTTSVIGGLMQTQRTSTITKIPILGDIPYLGIPFRRTVKSDTKTELLIFLTPYIVHTPEDLEASTADEVSRTQLMHKAFSEKELAEFLQATNFDNNKTGTQTSSSKSVTTVKAQASAPEVRRATAVIPAPTSKTKAAAR